MTLEELSLKYGIAQSTIKTKFKRAQETILKKYGIQIIKTGRGDSAEYFESINETSRALTLYEEKENTLFYMDDEIINLDRWELMVLIVLLIKPELVYRGTYKGLVEYLGKRPSDSNLGAISAAIDNLKNKGYVLMAKDDTDGYFILGLKRHVEKKIIDIELDMVKRCHEIAEINNKREWIPLLKVWAAAAYFHQQEPFTNGDIQQLTGLAESTIKDTKKLLTDSNVVLFNKDCSSVDGIVFCKGSRADINAFYKN